MECFDHSFRSELGAYAQQEKSFERKSVAGASRRQATTELRGAKQPPITCRV
ncbi:hypothetical protein BHM03_00018697, partial [Ensete ventricosum]